MFSLEQSRECYKHLINRMVHVFSPQVSGSSELNLSPFLIIWETLERRLIRSTFSSLGLPRPSSLLRSGLYHWIRHFQTQILYNIEQPGNY